MEHQLNYIEQIEQQKRQIDELQQKIIVLEKEKKVNDAKLKECRSTHYIRTSKGTSKFGLGSGWV